jgi:hypothetical protein
MMAYDTDTHDMLLDTHYHHGRHRVIMMRMVNRMTMTNRKMRSNKMKKSERLMIATVMAVVMILMTSIQFNHNST